MQIPLKYFVLTILLVTIITSLATFSLIDKNKPISLDEKVNKETNSLREESKLPFREYSVNEIQNNSSYEGTIGDSKILMTVVKNNYAEYIYEGISKNIISMDFKQSGESNNVIFGEQGTHATWTINSKTLSGEWREDWIEGSKILPIKLKKIPRQNVANIAELTGKQTPKGFLQIDCVLDAQKSTEHFWVRNCDLIEAKTNNLIASKEYFGQNTALGERTSEYIEIFNTQSGYGVCINQIDRFYFANKEFKEFSKTRSC